MRFTEWLALHEAQQRQAEKFRLSQLDDGMIRAIYEAFKASYDASTGQSWDFRTFQQYAGSWDFYGVLSDQVERIGFITVRPQRSGLIKFTGAAGNPRSIRRGMDLFLTTNQDRPIWGMMPSRIGDHLAPFGFTHVDSDVIMGIAKQSPELAHQLRVLTVTPDGGFSVATRGGLAPVTKRFYANKAYFQWLLSNNNLKLPKMATDKVMGMVDVLNKPGLLGRAARSAAGHVAQRALKRYASQGSRLGGPDGGSDSALDPGRLTSPS